MRKLFLSISVLLTVFLAGCSESSNNGPQIDRTPTRFQITFKNPSSCDVNISMYDYFNGDLSYMEYLNPNDEVVRYLDVEWTDQPITISFDFVDWSNINDMNDIANHSKSYSLKYTFSKYKSYTIHCYSMNNEPIITVD